MFSDTPGRVHVPYSQVVSAVIDPYPISGMKMESIGSVVLIFSSITSIVKETLVSVMRVNPFSSIKFSIASNSIYVVSLETFV